MPVQKNILVNGFVKGVTYRQQTQRIATTLGVNGWVRSLGNGRTEACLEGDEQAVDSLIAWCAFGSNTGKVEEVKITQYKFVDAYSEFRILPDRPGAQETVRH